MDQVCLPPVHLQPTAEADLVPVVDLDFGVLDGQPVQVRVWVREFPEHAVDLAGVQEPQEQVGGATYLSQFSSVYVSTVLLQL